MEEGLEALLLENRQEILDQCYGSNESWSSTMFPEWFSRPFSPSHGEIFEVLDDDSLQQVVILAPRGFGKTSLVSISLPAKKIAFRESKFIVPISCSATNAVMQSESLKRELMVNENLLKFFGNMESSKWSRDQWITSDGIMVMPRGSGQQVRGLLHYGHRPDLILIDDLEDSEGVRSEEQREKLKYWFTADVCNTVDRSRSDWRIIVIGTLLHEDSLLANLADDPNWVTVRLELCNDDYKSNWPEYKTDEEIKALAEEYRAKGLLDVFYQEFRNIPISLEDRTFEPPFQYYSEADLRRRQLQTVVLVDPAKTAKLHSAESAVVVVSIDAKEGQIFFRDCIAKKMRPDELYDVIFNLANQYKCRVVGVEVTGLEEFIVYPIKTLMNQRGVTWDLVELKPRGRSKEDRVAALVPFYRSKRVFHNPEKCGGLEGQLLSFPRPARWDIMDAFAYVIELLELGEYYFEYKESEEDIEKEYEELEYDNEPAMADDWRVA